MSDFPVTVIRTRNRHSRALLTESGIEIRLARSLPPHLEREHIESLSKRMLKIGMRERLKIRIDPFRNLLQSRTSGIIPLPDGGTIIIDWKEGKKTTLRRSADAWMLTVAPSTSLTHVHRLLWRMLCKTEKKRIAAEVWEVNERTYHLTITDISLRHTVSQWGSCGSRGRICLSAALLFVPKDLREYVIIHELAHLRHRNHGQRFWEYVEAAMPDFRERMRELRNYRVMKIR